MSENIIKPKAAILVGGLGTRLRPVIADKPKPMAEINGKPFLFHLLSWLKKQGIDDVVLCVGYRKEIISDYFGHGEMIDMSITYSVEESPLGTAGALKNAQKHLNETFIAMNGDSFLDISIKNLLDFHLKKNSIATLALSHVSKTSAFGAVNFRSDGQITNFAEKSSQDTGEGWINGGIYILEPSVLSRINEGKKVSLEQTIFPELIRDKLVNGLRCKGYFIDIGTPDTFLKSQKELNKIL